MTFEEPVDNLTSPLTITLPFLKSFFGSEKHVNEVSDKRKAHVILMISTGVILD